jgi:hypothetical protein
MRRLTYLCALALAVTGVSGCGFNKRVWLYRKAIALSSEQADLLSQVTDAASAKDAEPKLKLLKKRYDDDIKAEWDKLTNDKLKADEIREMKAYDKDLLYLAQRLGAEVARLKSRPDLWQDVQSGLLGKEGMFDLQMPQPEKGAEGAPGG